MASGGDGVTTLVSGGSTAIAVGALAFLVRAMIAGTIVSHKIDTTIDTLEELVKVQHEQNEFYRRILERQLGLTDDGST